MEREGKAKAPKEVQRQLERKLSSSSTSSTDGSEVRERRSSTSKSSSTESGPSRRNSWFSPKRPKPPTPWKEPQVRLRYHQCSNCSLKCIVVPLALRSVSCNREEGRHVSHGSPRSRVSCASLAGSTVVLTLILAALATTQEVRGRNTTRACHENRRVSSRSCYSYPRRYVSMGQSS